MACLYVHTRKSTKIRKEENQAHNEAREGREKQVTGVECFNLDTRKRNKMKKRRKNGI